MIKGKINSRCVGHLLFILGSIVYASYKNISIYAIILYIKIIEKNKTYEYQLFL